MQPNENLKISIFTSDQFGDVRTYLKDGEPVFCLNDICRALEIANARNVKSRLDVEDVRLMDTPTSGGVQSMAYVTEAGLYDVILRSDTPKAKPFRKWVTSELLPTVRRTGGYLAAVPEETPEETMARAILLAQTTIERQRQRVQQLEAESASKDSAIAEMKPKAIFADALAASDKSILVGELAKILRQNGIEMGQNRLFRYLRENGYLCTKGECYNQPSQKSLEMGLFEIKKTVVMKPNGDSIITTTSKVTAKGQSYFVNKFLAA